MQPIGPLMHEHRLIERMVDLIRGQAAGIEQGHEPDFQLIADAVEFFRVYADQCHHGKEEDLLFKALREKDIPDDLAVIMDELIREHQQGRAMVESLKEANRKCRESGQGAPEIMGLLNRLADFYPQHIQKEDKHFFFPVMEYFDRREMDLMLADFYEFDRSLIHDYFRGKVEAREHGS
jgi:hemerythrin-like domain-containing protein